MYSKKISNDQVITRVYPGNYRFGQIGLGKQCRPRSDWGAVSLIRVYTVCHSVCIVWTHYSMVEPHSSNFRVITTNILAARIFRKFKVILVDSWLKSQAQCFMKGRYRNDHKFSDRYPWANSADPDQTAPSLIRVYTVCHSVCIVWIITLW